MSHDRCCPLEDATLECAVCDAIAAARSEEKAIFQRVWQANMPLVERRNYLEGYADAAAHHPPRYQ